jgi:hypothetical protein
MTMLIMACVRCVNLESTRMCICENVCCQKSWEQYFGFCFSKVVMEMIHKIHGWGGVNWHTVGV